MKKPAEVIRYLTVHEIDAEAISRAQDVFVTTRTWSNIERKL